MAPRGFVFSAIGRSARHVAVNDLGVCLLQAELLGDLIACSAKTFAVATKDGVDEVPTEAALLCPFGN